MKSFHFNSWSVVSSSGTVFWHMSVDSQVFRSASKSRQQPISASCVFKQMFFPLEAKMELIKSKQGFKLSFRKILVTSQSLHFLLSPSWCLHVRCSFTLCAKSSVVLSLPGMETFEQQPEHDHHEQQCYDNSNDVVLDACAVAHFLGHLLDVDRF